MKEKDIDFKSMTLMMVSFFNELFHVVDKAALSVIELMWISP